MAKFNKPTPVRTPDTISLEGGEAFSRTDKDELFLLGISLLLGAETFYESADARTKRLVDLTHKVTKTDPAWVAGFAGWLRSSANIRSASVIVACEYLAAGGERPRRVIDSVCQRPDEPAEVIGYWHSTHGRSLPIALKRGVADAVKRLYNENAVIRYDGQSKAIRFGDVIEMTHPKATAEWQNALFRHCIDRRHGRGDVAPILGRLSVDVALQALPVEERLANLSTAIDTAGWPWERLAGWLPGGMTAEAWETVIPNMGLMALTRNLRNFDEAGISKATISLVKERFADADEVRKSRQFPLRFLTAWKNLTSMHWGEALETALHHSLANVPSLPGRTLVLIDVSPSMRDTLTEYRRGRPGATVDRTQRWEVASLFGYALAARAESATCVLFDFNPVATVEVGPHDSALRLTQDTRRYVEAGNGTDILKALAETYDKHDRVVILTDEQTGYRPTPVVERTWGGGTLTRGAWSDVAHIKVPVYTWNLGGYVVGVTPNERNWHTFGGLSDAAFQAIQALEDRRRHGWPWEATGAPTP